LQTRAPFDRHLSEVSILLACLLSAWTILGFGSSLLFRSGVVGLSQPDALIDLTNHGEVVLDPFLGSGSTLIAAEKTGRVCRGIELDPLYVDVIIRRYEAETARPLLPPILARPSKK